MKFIFAKNQLLFSAIECLCPKQRIIRQGGTTGRGLGGESRELKNGREISSFLTRLFCHVRTEKMAIYQLGSGTLADTESSKNLILASSPSRTNRNNFLLFTAHPTSRYFGIAV